VHTRPSSPDYSVGHVDVLVNGTPVAGVSPLLQLDTNNWITPGVTTGWGNISSNVGGFDRQSLQLSGTDVLQPAIYPVLPLHVGGLGGQSVTVEFKVKTVVAGVSLDFRNQALAVWSVGTV
jgi:hypothetical protein